MTDYIVYQTHLKPIGNGQLPDVIKTYVSDSLPHITYTRNFDDAYSFDKEEAEEIAYLLDAKMKEV